MSRRVILITGPSACGKTTVAKFLCKKIKKCVRLDIDRVKHFIENGFIYDDSKQGRAQWKLCTKNIIMLVKNFLSEGYTVIIEGVLGEERNYHEIIGAFPKVDKYLLMPDLKTLFKRNKAKTHKYKMSNFDIEQHFEYFTSGQFKDFTVIDSTHKSVEQVAKKIF